MVAELERWWVRLAEGLSILTAAAFLASALINTLIFATWQLNFFTVASIADVAMSGLTLLFIGLFVAAVGIVAAVRPKNPLQGRGRWLEASMIAICLCIPWSFTIIDPNPYNWIVKTIGLGHYPIIFMWGFLCSVAGWSVASRISVSLDALNLSPSLNLMVGVIPGCMAILAFLIIRISVHGYMLAAAHVSPPSPLLGCSRSEVMWAGDSSLVARCPNGSIFIIKGLENILID